MNYGDIKLCIDRCVAHDVPDCADMIEMLADQLAAIEHDRDNLLNQVVMLRGALDRIEAWREHTLEFAVDHGSNGVRDYYRQIAHTALAATNDLDHLILCEREPVGYLFQNEETGLTMSVDVQQVEWGFEKKNPRLINCGPLYRPRRPEC